MTTLSILSPRSSPHDPPHQPPAVTLILPDGSAKLLPHSLTVREALLLLAPTCEAFSAETPPPPPPLPAPAPTERAAEAPLAPAGAENPRPPPRAPRSSHFPLAISAPARGLFVKARRQELPLTKVLRAGRTYCVHSSSSTKGRNGGMGAMDGMRGGGGAVWNGTVKGSKLAKTRHGERKVRRHDERHYSSTKVWPLAPLQPPVSPPARSPRTAPSATPTRIPALCGGSDAGKGGSDSENGRACVAPSDACLCAGWLGGKGEKYAELGWEETEEREEEAANRGGAVGKTEGIGPLDIPGDKHAAENEGANSESHEPVRDGDSGGDGDGGADMGRQGTEFLEKREEGGGGSALWCHVMRRCGLASSAAAAAAAAGGVGGVGGAGRGSGRGKVSRQRENRDRSARRISGNCSSSSSSKSSSGSRWGGRSAMRSAKVAPWSISSGGRSDSKSMATWGTPDGSREMREDNGAGGVKGGEESELGGLWLLERHIAETAENSAVAAAAAAAAGDDDADDAREMAFLHKQLQLYRLSCPIAPAMPRSSRRRRCSITWRPKLPGIAEGGEGGEGSQGRDGSEE
ncbi:hypothetical protein CLOM_g17003 [Closterium sp. NIES-68]|nr:hypothetical protein CLOM_g17003 [Closterium sp. NIES-68]GJP77968.1 hypothetical protein CLOP_g8288 [Closterium sp. NIES-67]